MTPLEIESAAERLEKQGIYPWYYMRDDETPNDHPNGKYWILRVLMDSDQGREYEKLSTDTDRLEYMRQHFHDRYESVSPDEAFYEDREAGKRYILKMPSKEYDGLERLRREDGSSWDKETHPKEYGVMIQYYKDHATKVEDIPKCESC